MSSLKYLALLLVFSAVPVQAAVVEAWLDAWLELESRDGTRQLVAATTLPEPPLRILQQRDEKLLLRIERELVWVPRVSVRLDEEHPIIISCQSSIQSRAEDYKNFGMRGLSQRVVGQECGDEDENRLISQP